MNTLVDSFQRNIRYLRLSVSDQCDLRCSYCIPKGFTGFQEPDSWLKFDEIIQVLKLFTVNGVHSVRITGGEPLLRKNLPELTEQIRALPQINDIAISTNAVRLRNFAGPLKQAGVNRLNISLDSLKPERFRAITGGKLEKVLSGLSEADEAGFRNTKINMVVMKGVNDDEVEDMLEFCVQRQYTLRYIETMPMGDTGRLASTHYVNLQSVKQSLSERYNLIPEIPAANTHGMGPARYMQIAGTMARVGFITPISEHFCESCNRVRLSVDGTLYPCLGQNNAVALGAALRNGVNDQDLLMLIRQSITQKPERHEFKSKPEQILRFMSVTGG